VHLHLVDHIIAFPTFPDRMTDAQVNSGLVLPYAAVALMGSSGAVCALLIVFMAVTSALSSELIAVSSIFTYDIYQTYIKARQFNSKTADKAKIANINSSLMLAGADSSMCVALSNRPSKICSLNFQMAHCMVVGFGLAIAAFSTGLHYAGYSCLYRL
jgi:Na+/proline symporter